MLLAIIIELGDVSIQRTDFLCFAHTKLRGEDSSHGGSDDVWKRFWLMHVQKKETDDEP